MRNPLSYLSQCSTLVFMAYNIVDKNWGILGISCSTRDIHQKQLITGLRKPANLKDILVKAKLRDPPRMYRPQNLAIPATPKLADIALNSIKVTE